MNEADVARDARAQALLARGEAKAAAAEWAALAEAHPKIGELRFRLGVALKNAGDVEGARQAYEDAARLAPTHADARNNLGNLLTELDRHDEAVRALEATVALRPAHAPSLCNLGAARLKAGDAMGAIRDFRRAASLDPAYAPAQGNLGAALREQGDKNDKRAAIEAFRRALALDPAYAEAWSNLANALVEDGEVDQALEASARALALAPTSPSALSARAHVLCQLDRLDEASSLIHLALGLAPNHADALNHLGILRNHQSRNAEAAQAFAAAAKAKRNFVDAQLNFAMALLASGDYARGFAAYEARWRRPTSPPRGFPVKPWQGEALGGKTILLHTEQGLGDAIQFARFVPEVARRGGRVVIECQPELLRLFASLKGVAATLPRFSPLPPVDREAPLMSLPRLLGVTLESISGQPYLAPHAEIRRRFAALIDERARGRLKIGLVWAGNPKHGNDRRRSLSPALFETFAAFRNIAFFSLQKGRSETLPAELQAFDLAPELQDLADAAAAISALDLLVTVDTALAHLAGAVGAPTLLLLPAASDWRWLEKRQDTPWYQCLRLIRQDLDQAGDWRGPLQKVGEILKNRALRR